MSMWTRLFDPQLLGELGGGGTSSGRMEVGDGEVSGAGTDKKRGGHGEKVHGVVKEINDILWHIWI